MQNFVSLLFERNNDLFVTSVNPRSRIRVSKLLQEYMPNSRIVNTANDKTLFQYISLEHLLDDAEQYHQELRCTPKGNYVAENALRLIKNIRAQNNNLALLTESDRGTELESD